MTDSFPTSLPASSAAPSGAQSIASPSSTAMLEAQAAIGAPEQHSGMSSTEWARRRDTILTIVLWMLAVGIVFWLLAHVARVILLLVLSGLIAFALAPLTKVVARILPRPLAIILVYAAVLGALGGLGYLVVSVALSEGAALIAQVHTFLSAGPDGAPSPLVQKLTQLGISKQQIDHVTSQIEGQAQAAVPLLGQFLNDTLSLIVDIVLVVVLSIYLLIDGARLGKWLRATAPLQQRGQVVFVIRSVQFVVGGYIRGQLLLSTLIGLVVGLGMFALQVPFALLLGVLAFALEFIPTVGTLTSGVVCVAVAATQSWLLALVVLGYFILVHILEGYIVAPRILGKAVGLHPAISIVALVVGADLFGLWGALLAAPLAGLLQVLLAATWQAWREQNPRQFPEVFGPALVPVTTAGADAEMSLPAEE
jgi:predicted PurR-regulated permease PerM